MAATLFIEGDTDTFSGSLPPHNGSYAGDSSTAPGAAPRTSDEPVTVPTFPAGVETMRMAA